MSGLSVLVVASSFPANRQDWKGVFIRQLVEAMARQSECGRISLWAPPGEVAVQVSRRYGSGDGDWLAGLMEKGGIAHLLRTDLLGGIASAVILLYRLRRIYKSVHDVDVLFVNWLQSIIPLAGNKKPLLVTVLGSDMALLRFKPLRYFVRRQLLRRKSVVCPNAEWMVEPLRSALGPGVNIRHMAFGIEREWYEVRRSIAGNACFKWVVITRLTADKLGPLFEWGESHFNGERRELHLFGPMQEQVSIPEWVHYHGPVTPADLQSQWFPKACGLITLSRHSEGRPQIMLEAMAAGVPILASGIEAHCDFLAHKQSAWICEGQAAFSEGLSWLESSENSMAVTKAAKEWVVSNVGSWDDCARRYLDVLDELAVEGEI